MQIALTLAYCVSLSGVACERKTGTAKRKAVSRSGQDRCSLVRKGLTYGYVREMFGRDSDIWRQYSPINERVWNFKDGRCVVRFSLVAVVGKGQWLYGSGDPPKPRPGKVSCETIYQKQWRCIEPLVKLGVERMESGLLKRVKKHNPASLQQILKDSARRKKAEAKRLEAQLAGAWARHICKKRFGRKRSDQWAHRDRLAIQRCLRHASCAVYARCHWNLVWSWKARELAVP